MTQVGQAGAALVRCLPGDPRVQRANETWRVAHGLLSGATVTAETLQSVERGRVFFYGCLAHAKRGSSVCDNALVLPIDRVDDAVVSKLSRDVLHPAVVKAILDGVFEALQPATVTRNVGALRIELRALDTKIANLPRPSRTARRWRRSSRSCRRVSRNGRSY